MNWYFSFREMKDIKGLKKTFFTQFDLKKGYDTPGKESLGNDDLKERANKILALLGRHILVRVMQMKEQIEIKNKMTEFV